MMNVFSERQLFLTLLSDCQYVSKRKQLFIKRLDTSLVSRWFRNFVLFDGSDNRITYDIE